MELCWVLIGEFVGYRERFFKLVGNLLFYFRFTDVGSVDTKEVKNLKNIIIVLHTLII